MPDTAPAICAERLTMAAVIAFERRDLATP